MTASRVIRFARPASATHPTFPGTWTATVVLNETPRPAGEIMRRSHGWEYLLADGQPSGLSSADSRQDLERQVMLYYLGAVECSGSQVPPSPLKLAM